MVRRQMWGGVPRLVIDFRYRTLSGQERRYRRVALVQMLEAARREDIERQEFARTTGSPEKQVTEAPLFKTFVENWEALYLPRYRPATRERYKALLGQGLLSRFGQLPIDTITATAVLPWIVEMATRKRPVQSRPHLNLLRTILRAAVELGVLSALPPLPRPERSPRKIKDCPKPEQLAEWLQTSRGWLRTAIALGGLAGMRQGEVRALEVRDVDLADDVLLVRRAFSGTDVLEPKGAKERRVPIAPALRPVLVEAIKGKLPRAKVVVDAKGRTPRRQEVLRCFKTLQGGKGWSFHSLRHYCLTNLLRRGADVRSVMQAAGHSSLAVTSLYLHGSEASIRAAMGRESSGK